MLGAHGVMMAQRAGAGHEGILGGFLNVQILLQLAALELAAAEGEVEARAGVIVVADVAAHPRVLAGVGDGLFHRRQRGLI